MTVRQSKKPKPKSKKDRSGFQVNHRNISHHDEALQIFQSDFGFSITIENYAQLRSRNISGYAAYYLRTVF